MAFTVGHCTNLDYCGTASARQDVLISLGETFVCPGCGHKLAAGPAIVAKGRSVSRSVLVGVTALAVIGGYALALLGPPIATLRGATTNTQPAHSPAPKPPMPQAAAVPQPLPLPQQTILLRIAGENGTTLQLAPRLAESLLTGMGDTDIAVSSDQAARTVTVSGRRGAAGDAITIATSTSADALQSLASGQADIALSTRRVTAAERASMAALGDMTSPEAEHVLGVDGIAVVVNPANRLGQLTVAQLRAIYSGAVHDWSQLGGAPGPIDAWSRHAGGGTRDEFVKFVLGDTPMTNIPPDHVSDDDGPVVAAVGSDRGAIAYISQANIGSSRPLAIADTGSQALLPTAANLAAEEYPLTRRLYLYTARVPKNPLVARFAALALSDKGQDIVGQAGFVSLSLRQSVVSAPADASAAYRQLAGSALRLSVVFHFRPGSNDLDNRGLRDLDRVADWLAEKHWPSDRLILVGFADNSGTPEANKAIAHERAESVAALFANGGIVPGAVLSFGAEQPVADNSVQDGRDRNRRVEVFIRQGAGAQQAVR